MLVLSRFGRITKYEPLTRGDIAQLLRTESDAIRRTGDENARGLRDELADRVRDFQDNTTRTFTALLEGVNGQIRAFGERLDSGTKAIEMLLEQFLARDQYIKGNSGLTGA